MLRYIKLYREIKEDGHPIIVVSAVDIVGILKKSGIGTVSDLQIWAAEFTKSGLASTLSN
jgi:hypothetical protein